MNWVKLLFFPFARSFERLQLSRRWWHRLFFVLFLAGLPALCLYVWLSLNVAELDEYSHCYDFQIRYGHEENASEYCEQLYHPHPWTNFAVGVGAALLSGYVLQIAYRVGLYIAFGKSSQTKAGSG
jgi:hypothetical protein